MKAIALKNFLSTFISDRKLVLSFNKGFHMIVKKIFKETMLYDAKVYNSKLKNKESGRLKSNSIVT